MNKEYIERETAIAAYCDSNCDAPECCPYECNAVREVRKIPAANVIQVVRCGECKHFGRSFVRMTGYCSHPLGLRHPRKHFFCPHGVRRDKSV